MPLVSKKERLSSKTLIFPPSTSDPNVIVWKRSQRKGAESAKETKETRASMASATRNAGASIDLEALDALVVRTARELYCAGSHSRVVSERARESVLSGDVLSALRWAEHEKGGSGAVLEDKRLLFKLKKQHFLELALAADGTEDLELALRYCREDLAPLALEAYPEAYDEFKSAMFAVVSAGYGLDKAEKLGAAEGRPSLAAALSLAMRKETGAREPDLLLLLRHLLLLRAKFANDDVSDAHLPLAEPTDGAFLLPVETPGASSQVFPESVVLPLRDAACVTSREATEALRHFGGDVESALESELLRVRLNEEEIGELIAEYATRRGLFSRDQSEFSWAEAAAGCPAIASALASWEDGTGRERAARDAAEAAAAGRSKEAEAVLDCAFPGLVARSPRLAFEIKRRELLGLMRGGKQQLQEALDIARGDLRDLVDRDPGLMSDLKRTMASLVFYNKGAGYDDGEGEVEVARAIAEALGVGPPRLQSVLGDLLELQAKLLEADEILGLDKFERLVSTAASLRSKEAAEMDEGEPPEEVQRFEECTILTLMEFMSSTRARAIELLCQHDGNLEQCLETVFV